jgi:hypothetical protein
MVEHVVPEVDITNDVAGSQSNGPYPASFQGYINDPNSLLREAIEDQDILGTIIISLSTDGVGSGIENIPFLGIANSAQLQNPANSNAFVSLAMATFWIEWVRLEGGADPLPSPGGHGQPTRPVSDIEPFWPEPTFLQLQYSQVSILVFNGVLWPHVNVATLTLSHG